MIHQLKHEITVPIIFVLVKRKINLHVLVRGIIATIFRFLDFYIVQIYLNKFPSTQILKFLFFLFEATFTHMQSLFTSFGL